MMGLGYMGLSDKTRASEVFEKALEITPCHYGVRLHKEELERSGNVEKM